MIQVPNCYKRKCIRYLGIIQPNNDESIELPNCKVYPDGIPNDIAYGNKRCDKLRTAEPDPEDFDLEEDML